MEKQWIENLRKRFTERQIPVADDVWSGISAALDGLDDRRCSAVAPVGRMRRLSLWTRRVAAVAAVVAVVAGVWYFSGKDVVSPIGVTRPAAADVARYGGQPSVAPLPATGMAPLRRLLSAMSRNTVPPSAVTLSAVAVADTVKPSAGNTDMAAGVQENKGNDSQQGRTPANGRAPQQGADSRRQRISTPDAAKLLAASSARHGEGGASFGLYGTNFTSFGSSSGAAVHRQGYAGVQHDGVMGDNHINLLTPSNGGLLNATAANPVKVKHRQPVKLGLSVRVKLNRRLALESGLAYSYLSSDISSGDGRGGYSTTQRLHYVGVPLNINVDLWHNKRLEVYASGGGAVDFCVSGRSETETFAGNEVTSHDRKAMRETRPQLSVNASAGVQYNFNSRLGVYAEPGVGYYFDNGSGVQTVYKDNKLNFNLNVGLRLTVK